MLDKALLNEEIEAALAAPASEDAVLAAMRSLGLGFMIEARPGQSLEDVARVFHGFSSRFEVRPALPPLDGPSWRDTAFVAAIEGVAAPDVTANPWDIAHAARLEGGLARVYPDVAEPWPETPPETPQQAVAYASGWEFACMSIDGAWKVIRGRGRRPGQGIVIGHPDTGWAPHQVFTKENLDLENQFNFLNNTRDARDPVKSMQTEATGSSDTPGHGTATASVMIAPETGLPMRGAAPFAKVTPLRCITTVVQPTERPIMEAIDYARRLKCHVVSLSLGGGLGTWGRLLERATNDAIGADIIVVAAAGQYVPGRYVAWPARYPNVIGVSGVQQTAGGYGFWDQASRFPTGSVDISAPATPVMRGQADPNRTDRFGPSDGTSYATAFLAAIAALWLSHHFPQGYRGSRKAQFRFRDHVKSTAHTRHPDYSGIVQAERLMATQPPTDEAVAAEGAAEATAASALARLAGQDDAAAAGRLLCEMVLGRPEPGDEAEADALGGWTDEVVSLLCREPALAAGIAEGMGARTADAAALRALIAPHASQALGDQFASAAPA